MEEKFGLVMGVECKFVKTDPEIIEAMATRIGKDKAQVKCMMRYNLFTISQYACLSGLAISTILNKTRPSIVDKTTGALGTELDFCYPFQDCVDSGPKFILRNEKSEKYLKA
jgi:hypothetical protein